MYLFKIYSEWCICIFVYIDGLVQERRNSIANALELRFSCTNPSKLFISVQGTMLEQLWLNGFTPYKYICNANNDTATATATATDNDT